MKKKVYLSLLLLILSPSVFSASAYIGGGYVGGELTSNNTALNGLDDSSFAMHVGYQWDNEFGIELNYKQYDFIEKINQEDYPDTYSLTYESRPVALGFRGHFWRIFSYKFGYQYSKDERKLVDEANGIRVEDPTVNFKAELHSGYAGAGVRLAIFRQVDLYADYTYYTNESYDTTEVEFGIRLFVNHKRAGGGGN